MQKMKLFYKVMILYECVQFEFYAVKLDEGIQQNPSVMGSKTGLPYVLFL